MDEVYAFRSKHYSGKFQDSREDLADQDKLERCSEQGHSKNGVYLGRGWWSISSRQTDLASTCGPMHRRCWMNQVKSIHSHTQWPRATLFWGSKYFVTPASDLCRLRLAKCWWLDVCWQRARTGDTANHRVTSPSTTKMTWTLNVMLLDVQSPTLPGLSTELMSHVSYYTIKYNKITKIAYW